MTTLHTLQETTSSFFKQHRLVAFTKGEQILAPDSSALPPISYIEKGFVAQYDISASGNKVILNIFKPGAFFPAASAINKTPNAFFYEASSDVEIRQADTNDVAQLLSDNPAITMDLLSRLYKGIDGLLGKMSLLLDGSAQSRIMYELVVMGERFGEKDSGTIRINITETKLAEQVGLTRETVSRTLKSLKDSELLSLERGVIILHNN